MSHPQQPQGPIGPQQPGQQPPWGGQMIGPPPPSRPQMPQGPQHQPSGPQLQPSAPPAPMGPGGPPVATTVKPRTRKRWVIVAGVVGLVLGIGMGNAGGGGNTTAAPAGGATVTVTATAPAPAASQPAPASSAPAVAPTTSAPPAPPATVAAGDFTVEFTITSKQCFGSAGCNIEYRVEPKYKGAADLSDKKLEVLYEIRGVEDGPEIRSFTVESGEARWDEKGYASIPASNTKVTAVVTKVNTITY